MRKAKAAKVQLAEVDNERTRRYSAKQEEKLHKEHRNAFPCAFCNGPHRENNHRRCRMSKLFREMQAAAEAAVTPKPAEESNNDHWMRVVQVIRQKYDQHYRAVSKERGEKIPFPYNFAESERLFRERHIENIFMLPRYANSSQSPYFSIRAADLKVKQETVYTEPLHEQITEPLTEENTQPSN